MTDTDRRMKAAASQAVSYRNYRRARDRALARLANAYPEHYKELLEQEKANDEAQGRKWLDISGNTGSVDTRPTTPVNAQTTTDNQGENEGNYGGEA
jgi:hypothetical protein